MLTIKGLKINSTQEKETRSAMQRWTNWTGWSEGVNKNASHQCSRFFVNHIKRISICELIKKKKLATTIGLGFRHWWNIVCEKESRERERFRRVLFFSRKTKDFFLSYSMGWMDGKPIWLIYNPWQNLFLCILSGHQKQHLIISECIFCFVCQLFN